MRVLITGSNGQVGQALKSISKEYFGIDFLFLNSTLLDITSLSQCREVFSKTQPDYCINLAAYTAVDKAEDEVEKAYLVNAEGVKCLAQTCRENGVILIQISTDFVFDGNKRTPYTIMDEPNPINVYGSSKLKGEEYIKDILDKYYIVRTSWIYSEFGNNFKRTMLRLGETKKEISVVNDQIGCPTDAVDLSQFLMRLIQDKKPFGVYHYSGEKVCSWYEFAVSIFEEAGIGIQVNAIGSEEFAAKAKRPKYSVLR